MSKVIPIDQILLTQPSMLAEEYSLAIMVLTLIQSETDTRIYHRNAINEKI